MMRKMLDQRSMAVLRQARRLGSLLLAKRRQFDEAESKLQDLLAIHRERLRIPRLRNTWQRWAICAEDKASSLTLEIIIVRH